MSERNPPSNGQEPDQSTLDQLLAQVFEDCHEWRTEQEDKGHVALDNECRKYCYRTMANLLWGHLGARNRRKLPVVVVNNIRNKYPGTVGGKYMGFRSIYYTSR